LHTSSPKATRETRKRRGFWGIYYKVTVFWGKPIALGGK
jgi:hypothetical protein